MIDTLAGDQSRVDLKIAAAKKHDVTALLPLSKIHYCLKLINYLLSLEAL